MRRGIGSIVNFIRRSAPMLVSSVLLAGSVWAQVPTTSNQSRSSQTNQLPLSGRSVQTGSVSATQAPVPGATTSVNTLNPTVQVQGPYSGSTLSTAKMPFLGTLSLRDAVRRGIEYNLGAIGLNDAVRQSRGQAKAARSVLLPSLNANITETAEQLNLNAIGLKTSPTIGGFTIPSVVGPLGLFDARASLTQTVLDLTAWHNYRSATETSRANELSAQDATDLVVFAVGGVYLQVIAAKAKLDSARAQLNTANALYQQTQQQRNVGVVAQIDVNRSQIQALTQQQRIVSLQNDLAKLKISLARLAGLPANDLFDVSDDVPYTPAPPISADEALKQAFEHRSDLKAAEAQVRAAERTRAAARSERLPSLALTADYGVLGLAPTQSHGTFNVAATLRIPIWQGGRAEANIEQAEAALAQRRAELEDVRGRIEGEVRNAFLDLQAATSQVEVALKNIQVSQQNLSLTRQRFEAGVSDNVEVVQSQESVATSQLDYITSVFAHNLAKLTLARAIGGAAESLSRFLSLQ